MRLLAHAGISPKTADFLWRNAHNVVYVRELKLQRTMQKRYF